MKRFIFNTLYAAGDIFPPLIRGGLIEADLYEWWKDPKSLFPPLIRGGLIEAGLSAAARAGPPLFPPLIRGGLIEANRWESIGVCRGYFRP